MYPAEEVCHEGGIFASCGTACMLLLDTWHVGSVALSAFVVEGEVVFKQAMPASWDAHTRRYVCLCLSATCVSHVT